MEFYEIKDLLMGNVKIVEYVDECSDMRTVYEGDIEDLDDGDSIMQLQVCSIEPSGSDYVLIYVEGSDDIDYDDFDDMCDDYEATEDEDLSEYTIFTDLEEEE